MRYDRGSSRRATALIVVVGTLMVLSTLAISFARLTRVERDVAKIRSDEVQARFCSWAGYERAVEEIEAAVQAPFDNPDERATSWFYRGHTGNPAGNGVPLDEAALPSFWSGRTAYGRAYSGTLRPTYEEDGDTYVVKVLDAASMINLNQPADPRLPDRFQPLVRVLANLGRAIDGANPPVTPSDAEKIMAYRSSRPGGRFESRRELLQVPGNPITAYELERIADFVTCHSWADSTMVASMDPALVPSNGSNVFGRVPTGALLPLSRSPVNVNTAPVEVLVAVFADLAGFWIDRSDRTFPDAVGIATHTAPVAFGTAREIARAVVARRESSPFQGWYDFRAFLAGLVGATIDARQADAILANCDPNIDTHRANPDLLLWKEIDKFDLTSSTTELSFNSGGVFEIESLGRVTANGGEIRAQAVVRAVVEVFQMYRESTQSQFNAGRVTVLEIEFPTLHEIREAILTQGPLELNGTPQVKGGSAGVHTNSDLKLIGTPDVAGDATASGGYDDKAASGATVGPGSGGGKDPVSVPDLRPEDYKSQADFIFKGDGTVTNQAGGTVANGSYRGFTFKNGEWKSSCGDTTPGTYYFEGNVEISGGTNGATWKITIFATGHIGLRGNPIVQPNHSSGIGFLAGTDQSLQGTPGANLRGLFYAGEQIDLGGNLSLEGCAIAKDRSASDRFVTANKVSGSVIVEYDGGIVVPGDKVKHKIETLAKYPDPDAIGIVNGSPVNLMAYNQYDGYIGLAPVNLPPAVLGTVPYKDSILASWEGPHGLAADLGGGALVMALDAAGPVVQPIAGGTLVGNLIRDGVYCERSAVGAFEATDNVGPLRGTISFWFKPSWRSTATQDSDPNPSERSHHILSLSRRDGETDQRFGLFHWFDGATGRSVFHFDRSSLEEPPDPRRRIEASPSGAGAGFVPPAHAWTHVVLVYDFEDTNYQTAAEVYVNGVRMPPEFVHIYTDSYALIAPELAKAAINAGNLLRLGERTGNDFELPAMPPDGTYDELACVARKEDATWVDSIVSLGRYYSGGDAKYTSSVLPVPAGARLVHATWTVRYPENWAGPDLTVSITGANPPVSPVTVPSSAPRGGIRLGGRVIGPLGYEVLFQPRAPVPGAPFTTTPIMDDFTVAYSTGVRVLAWDECP